MFGVKLARLDVVMLRLRGVAVRRVRVMAGLLVVSGLVMLGRLAMMVSGLLVMLRSLAMVFGGFMRHGLLSLEARRSD